MKEQSRVSLQKNRFSAASKWLLSSGIQSQEGGFYSWYNISNKSYPYYYSEITGYGITALLFLYEMSRRKEAYFLEKAELAAQWIINEAMHPCGGVKTRLYTDQKYINDMYSFESNHIFSFDTGMVLYGFINLFEVTQKNEYLLQAIKMAEFLESKMFNANGSLNAIYDSDNGVILDPRDKWSSQPAGFHAKVAMGFLDLYQMTSDKRFKDVAIRICGYALNTQEESGRFITDCDSQSTHVHPHCYTAEGLSYVGGILGITEFLVAAEKATEWALENVSPAGIFEIYDPLTGGFNDLRRCDVIAQVLRLACIFQKQEKKEILLKVLDEHQYFQEGSIQSGGFLYSTEGEDINAWVSMFAMQACALVQYPEIIPQNHSLKLLI